MSMVFDYQKEAENNPNINTGIITDTMRFQKFLIKTGVGKKASYKIDRPSEQCYKSFRPTKEAKVVTRVF